MVSSQSVMVDTERYHPNPFLQVEETFNVFAKGSDSFQAQLQQACSALLKRLTQDVLSRGFGDDASIYTGYSGIFLTFYFIQSINPEAFPSSLHDTLQQFATEVQEGNILRGKRFTFLCGDAGPIVTAYLLTSNVQQRAGLLQRLLKLQDLVFAEKSRDGSVTPNELLYGRVGYLYSLLFLNEKFSKEPPLISADILSKVVSRIIEDGLKNHKPGGAPLHYEWHEKMYLGAAHGYVGILYILLKARTFMTEEHVSKLKETLDWILETQQFPSGNLRSSVGSKDDKLVHWCHGAVGGIFLFLEAAKVFEADGERYLSSALAAGKVVWTRGILKRSYSLCHGTAGNAYALMALYKHTKDSLWLKRSCLFAQFCFSWGKNSTREPDRPASLFEGLAGTVYMVHDFHNFLTKEAGASSGCSGSTPKFPAFELD